MKVRHALAAALVGAFAAIFSPAFAPAQSSVAETLSRFGRFLHNDGMIGVVVDFALATPPAGWLLCHGQALAPDTPYQALRAKLIASGSPYGSSGGNPLLPDARGRVIAGKDNMGGAAAGRLNAPFTVSGATLGAAGGWEGHTLSVGQMPSHGHGVNDPAHAHSVYDPGHLHWTDGFVSGGSGGSTNYTPDTAQNKAGRPTQTSVTGISIYAAATGISIQANGGGEAHPNVQPTIVLNKIIFAGI